MMFGMLPSGDGHASVLVIRRGNTWVTLVTVSAYVPFDLDETHEALEALAVGAQQLHELIVFHPELPPIAALLNSDDPLPFTILTPVQVAGILEAAAEVTS